MEPTCVALGELLGGPVAQGSVTRGGRVLRWAEAGTGAPVVLAPGAGETALTWAPLFADLVARSRVIAYDRASLGSSDPDGHSTAASGLEDLAAVVGEVGPAVVVGHSWGGLLAEMLALTRPGLVAGLVLIDPTHEDVFTEIPRRMRVAEGVMLRGIVIRSRLGRAKPIVRAMGEELAERSTSDEHARSLVVAAYEASYSTTSQLAAIGRENRISGRCAAWANAIRARHQFPDVPIEMMTAGQKPFAERSQELNESISVAMTSTRVDDSGHYIHHECPALVVEALDRVLRRVG